jgi:hypothetical protein
LLAKASSVSYQAQAAWLRHAATGLHKLLSKTATHVFECLRDAPGTKPYDVPNAMTVVRTSSGN